MTARREDLVLVDKKENNFPINRKSWNIKKKTKNLDKYLVLVREL